VAIGEDGDGSNESRLKLAPTRNLGLVTPSKLAVR
jgi:hypothetical protein